MKYKVRYVKRIPFGYIGMNFYAAKAHGIPFPYPKHTILVKRGMSKDLTRHTILHERSEAEFMKNKHWNYHEAHREALRLEGE